MSPDAPPPRERLSHSNPLIRLKSVYYQNIRMFSTQLHNFKEAKVEIGNTQQNPSFYLYPRPWQPSNVSSRVTPVAPWPNAADFSQKMHRMVCHGGANFPQSGKDAIGRSTLLQNKPTSVLLNTGRNITLQAKYFKWKCHYTQIPGLNRDLSIGAGDGRTGKDKKYISADIWCDWFRSVIYPGVIYYDRCINWPVISLIDLIGLVVYQWP